jgi:hypothetical protein
MKPLVFHGCHISFRSLLQEACASESMEKAANWCNAEHRRLKTGWTPMIQPPAEVDMSSDGNFGK